MKIVITPAKRMNDNIDYIDVESLPVFLPQTEELLGILKTLKVDEVKKMLGCNDQIAQIAYLNYQMMDLKKDTVPALLAYEGIQYKYMSPNSLNFEELEYIEKHLRILSGFYGILNPFDGVVPYRLEMMAKFKTNFCKNLYDFWKDDLYKELTKESRVVLNLASKEYSKTIEKYLTSEDIFVTVIFGSLKDNKIKVKATEAKMARGLMVRFMAQNNIDNLEDVKKFSDLGFKFSKEHSNDKEFVFIK